MFGPLPRLHRIVIVAITLCCGVVGGAWVAHVTTLPLAVSMGALLGGVLGLAAAYAVVHEPHPQPKPVRVHRRR
jgi:hypothetical protein